MTLCKINQLMKHFKLKKISVFAFRDKNDILNYLNDNKGILVAVNAEKILHTNEQIQNLINNNIGYADGIGAVWALKKKGFKDAVKIPGCELWLDIVRYFHKTKNFFLIGAKEEVINQTIEQLKNEFPGIKIIGYRNGYIETEEEQQELIKTIATFKPEIIFVAMGSPKQELLMQEMQQQHKAIYQGLGGSFDVYTGNVERAPVWWVKNNLEWAYRLAKQPFRIKRQIHLLKFAWLLLLNRI